MDSTGTPCPADRASDTPDAEPAGLFTARRALQLDFPGWAIGQDPLAPASTRLVAVRKTPLSPAEKRLGFRGRITAGDLDELEARLRTEQAAQDRHHRLHTTANDGGAA
ncbi:hypothetical protein J0910_30595 [Nocardiopsis sp. CNT-189]|uniref:hypothetical protein n=1 Tax=Nocardiopsis oceanisediminis TaxID=2816862 RepID=UPI003B2C95E3